MSWKPEVLVLNDPKWYGNALTFETKDEAEAYVRDLGSRWTSVRKTRVTECDDPVTGRWSLGRAAPIGTHDFVDANGPEPEDAA